MSASDLLTAEERQIVHDLGKIGNRLSKVVGTGRTRDSDLTEAIAHLHALQHLVLCQAAGRAYPKEFRLLGESLS